MAAFLREPREREALLRGQTFLRFLVFLSVSATLSSMDQIVIRVRSQKLLNGGWAPDFELQEHDGPTIKVIHHYFDKEVIYKTKEEADILARNSAITLVNNKYPKVKGG